MIWVVGILLVMAFVFFSALFSGSETGIYCINRLRLRLQADQGQVRSLRLRRILADEQQALAMILVGTNVANYLTTVTAAALLSHELGLSDRATEIYTTLLVTPLLFVFGEVLPKNLFQRQPDPLLQRASLPLTIAHRVLFPVVWCVRWIAYGVTAAIGVGREQRKTLDHRDRVAGLLREALAGSEHAEEHGEFVERVLRLSTTRLDEIMVPASQVASLPADTGREEFRRVIERRRLTRFPVYATESSSITGIVHTHKLLADPNWKRVGERVEQVQCLRPEDSVAAAIVQARRTGLRMAVVTDARGKLLGIVTLKDLFEEIVGELAVW